MASTSQVPSSSSCNNKNLYDVLRSLSSRSLRKRRRIDDGEINQDDGDKIETPHSGASNLSSPSASMVDTMRSTAQLEQDKEDREDRFAQLASTVLYVDPSCWKNVKRQRNVEDESNAQNTSKASVTNVTKDSNSLDVVDVHIQSDIDRYKQLLKAEDEEIKHVQDTRNRVIQDQIELWALYKYGLAKINNLNDLSKAPDAIMPGNFGQ